MNRLLLSSLPVLLAFAAACSDKSSDAPAAPAPAAKAEAPKPAPAAAAAPAAAPAEPAAAPAATGDAAAVAKEMFQSRCVICHGATGKGDGVTAATLNPKPRDFSSAEWQKAITDDDIAKIILEGGPAVGKSPLMPANPDLKDKPDVVKELVAHIRAFAPKS